MAKEFVVRPDLATKALVSPRLSFLGKVGTDLSTIGTWDRHLSRRTRILVPVDVQAFVARADAPEATVPLRGRDGDPAPFADGAPKPPGVHLHWAMPDALTAAHHDQSTGSVSAPALPDQWAVVRTLQPVGSRQVVATGWVVDARTATVTPLATFAGPATALDAEALSPVRAISFGLMWTASYAASENRFAFHDPLDDLDDLRTRLAAQGFAGDQAVYTVAGWWIDETQDPLDHARGPAGLDSALAGLGWRIDHDANDDDVAEPGKRSTLLAMDLGLKQPVENVAPRVFSQGSKVGGALRGVATEAGYPIEAAEKVWVGDALPTYHSLLHGSVLGVPVGSGDLPAADDRPAAEALELALGTDVDDVVAAFGAAGLGLGVDARRLAEDMLAAFSMGSVNRLGSSDGLDEIGQREHENGFWSLPGTPLPAARADRLRTEDSLASGPMTVGRKGRAGGAAAEVLAQLSWRTSFDLEETGKDRVVGRKRVAETDRPPTRVVEQTRSVGRPAPRFFRPQPPLVALRGAHPSHRHHGDGLFDPSGRLLCRYPRSAVPRYDGLVDGSSLLPSLGSGAVPAEVTTVVREAVLLNPYAGDWLAAAGATDDSLLRPYTNRILGEMVRLYGAEGRYDATTHLDLVPPKAAAPKGAKAAQVGAWKQVAFEESPELSMITAQLATHSALRGLPPSPVALTTWRQPWVPLWLEWQVTLTGHDSLRGWHLDGFDLETGDESGDEPGGNPVSTTLHGRSPIGQGVGDALRAAVTSWLSAENSRAVTNGTDPFGTGAVIRELGNLDRPLDLVSASLDGIREQLLGLDFVGQVVRDGEGKVPASGDPTTLFGGTLRVDRLRLVDGFGRTLAPPDAALDAAVGTIELETDRPRTFRLRPRFQGSARWLLRLLDADQPPGTPLDTLREAYVDQVEPEAAPNPVAGFLLPDHIDESLEAFTVRGAAIGEIGHDEISGAVSWEPAPGREVRADAGPLVGIDAQDRLVAEVAAGLVRADAGARAAGRTDSALVNLLRAVDTTLWTVDTYAALGSGTVAALVGRPIAVVRASLTLDVADDLDEVTVTAVGGAAHRRARFDALAGEQVEVKLGTLTRSDDALLGYFVDDDYEHLHLVDKVLAVRAMKTGRQIGQLGLLADATGAPDTTTLDHPYLVTDGILRVRPRQTTMLTLLMLPMGRVHLTSGVLPRKEIGLADSWFTPGMKKLMPSVRVGPLLVDPAEIRLPLVSLLGDKQTFTRRTGELSWKDDPILAASQTAYLPVLPHEAQEGWVRVTPQADDQGDDHG